MGCGKGLGGQGERGQVQQMREGRGHGVAWRQG